MFKKHLGSRVGFVVVATALMLIVTAAPALAVAPTITSFTPTTAPVGCAVLITGTNFNNPNVTSVTFNATAATGFTIDSATRIVATVGAGTTGTGSVVVSNGDLPNGTMAGFTVGGTCTPTITSFSPPSGAVGTAVTINGANLLNATAVRFGGVSAAFSVVTTSTPSASQVTAIVPAGAPASSQIQVDTPIATASSSTNFTVGTGPAPTITSFTPTSGVVGTSVVITGTNFTGATGVSFNNVAATTFTVNSATQITATVPTGATTGPIRVTTPSGTGVSATNFTVTTAPAPTITSFSPTFGKTGKVVTITGTNFSGTGFTTTAVRFNGVSATFTVNSATQITATVPSGATTGRITVTTPGGTATSSTDFVVSTLHSRTVTLQLRRHIIARGDVSAGGFAACDEGVEVKIQRRTSGNWRTVGTDTTSSNGSFSVRVGDREGRYRAKAPRVVLGNGADICSPDTSPSRRHSH